MRQALQRLAFGLGTYMCGATITALCARPAIWSSAGVALPPGCEESTDVVSVASPDRAASVEVRCGALDPKQRVVLRIVTAGGLRLVRVIEPGAWRPQEVVWAPDSSAFVVNGSESSIAGNDFVVYRLGSDDDPPASPTHSAQRHMVSAFPPCRAEGITEPDCRTIENNPQFNMSVIAWTRGATAIVIFAEVPCSSTFGGIMCQVMGFELEVPSGRILARMNARELKRRYQPQMAWTMRIPDEPSYKKR